MSHESPPTAIGTIAGRATREVLSGRFLGARPIPGAHGFEDRGGDAIQVNPNVDSFTLVAAALGGLILTCSALRARYNERILELEREIVRLSSVADRDPLTALGNRRSFERCLGLEWRRALRHGSHLTLALVDVDHFKLFNDAYGHPAGDRALQRVARCLAGTLGRATDGVFRIGGEEFALVLPDTDRAGAELIGRLICDAVRSAALPHGRSPSGVVTASFGSCSGLIREGDEMDDLVSLADRALYGAKNGGRDRAVSVHRGPSLRGGASPRIAVLREEHHDRPGTSKQGCGLQGA